MEATDEFDLGKKILILLQAEKDRYYGRFHYRGDSLLIEGAKAPTKWDMIRFRIYYYKFKWLRFKQWLHKKIGMVRCKHFGNKLRRLNKLKDFYCYDCNYFECKHHMPNALLER
jgi:hypothetical protein